MDIICPLYPDKLITIGNDLRTSSGPDVSRLIFGTEGSCVIIVNASIKIKKLPEQKIYDSYIVPSWEIGTKFLREVQKSGQLPASLRMVDNLQFQFGQSLKPEKSYFEELISFFQKKLLVVLGFDLTKICACTIVYEGGIEECASIKKRMNNIANKYRIFSGGSENGKAGYNLTNAIAYIRDFADTLNVFGDTFEITVNWSGAETAGKIITDNLKKTHSILKKNKSSILKGDIFVSYRATQLYETGVCLYFTYAYYCYNFTDIEIIQKEIEATLKASVDEIGSTLSHHHGIGKLKKDAYKKRYPYVENVTNGLKTCFDPDNIICARNNYF
jgi:alkyldihydroxyacetonephosphate synthase